MRMGTAARTPRLPTREVLQEPADIDTWVIRGVSLLALLEARAAPVPPAFSGCDLENLGATDLKAVTAIFGVSTPAMPLAYALPKHSKRAPLSP